MLTPTEKKDKMRTFIDNNYDRISSVAKKVSKSPEYEDLLHETILNILQMKNFPDDIFLNGKEFLYIYSIIHRQYFAKGYKFKERHGLKQEGASLNYTHEWIEDRDYAYDLEIKRDIIKEYISKSLEKKKLHWYDAEIFLMFFFPEDHINFNNYNLTERQKNRIIKKMSYRKLEQLTGINYQSLRLTITSVLNKIKADIKEESLEALDFNNYQ